MCVKIGDKVIISKPIKQYEHLTGIKSVVTKIYGESTNQPRIELQNMCIVYADEIELIE